MGLPATDDPVNRQHTLEPSNTNNSSTALRDTSSNGSLFFREVSMSGGGRGRLAKLLTYVPYKYQFVEFTQRTKLAQNTKRYSYVRLSTHLTSPSTAAAAVYTFDFQEVSRYFCTSSDVWGVFFHFFLRREEKLWSMFVSTYMFVSMPTNNSATAVPSLLPC